MKLHLNANHSFQILQITDLHLKDYPWSPADEQTFIHIKETVERYRADLVIFTGDMIWATLTNNPLVSYQQFITFCHELAVHIAITYGNHDTNHPIMKSRV
ncbi:metallophosphoesterase [Globicatella sulfidifaciens]|uniref:metallophosphoesterase n=1 Tax=Globicatella sulfidifaciens TaxID=136093 RepID=UPI00288F432B|nr:metallophosphoesterase [Globicatella sulfidifaciens]MDT2768906.1 metallophosphoesterase [Globicatella sulfidifaciens]